MILPIRMKSSDPAGIFRNRTGDLEGCLSLAQISPHLAYSLDRQTYTQSLKNSLSITQEKNMEMNQESCHHTGHDVPVYYDNSQSFCTRWGCFLDPTDP